MMLQINHKITLITIWVKNLEIEHNLVDRSNFNIINGKQKILLSYNVAEGPSQN